MMKLNEKKFLTISKRCCKIYIAVAKSDKKQSVKAKKFLIGAKAGKQKDFQDFIFWKISKNKIKKVLDKLKQKW